MSQSQIESIKSLGIIAGGGQFPELIAKEAKSTGHQVFICGFYENTDDDLVNYCDKFIKLHLGQLTKLIEFFKDNKVKNLCFAGSINKPKALNIRPDWRAAKLLFSLRAKGDDVLLRTILSELEKDGFNPLSAADLLPSLRAPKGNLTTRNINDELQEDLDYGLDITRKIGQFDIGQCVIARNGIIMAVESLEGTDATIQRGAELGGENCIAIKISKPKQDVRVDLPSVGLQTIENLIKYKYSALVIESYNTLFFDREKSIALAKKHNLHIISV